LLTSSASVPVTGGVRLRVGKSRGTYIQGEEAPTVIDSGVVSVTTQRVVFQGPKYTREWDFSKLLGVMHYSDRPASALQVSNRQKTSGLVYQGEIPEVVRLSLAVAVAIYDGEAAEAAKELTEQLDELSPPETEAGAAAPARFAPPAWVADPTGRHQWRYWDGAAWTAEVADDGKQAHDPLAAPPPE